MSCFKKNRPSIPESVWSDINRVTLMEYFLLSETTNEMRLEVLNKALSTIKCVFLENGFTLKTLGPAIDKANNSFKEAFENPTLETVAFIPSALGTFVSARDLDALVAEYKRNTGNKSVTTEGFLKILFLFGGGRFFNMWKEKTTQEQKSLLVDAIKAGNEVDTADYAISKTTATATDTITTTTPDEKGFSTRTKALIGVGLVGVLGGSYLLMRKK